MRAVQKVEKSVVQKAVRKAGSWVDLKEPWTADL